jgi:purine-nucleoside phosphorylase
MTTKAVKAKIGEEFRKAERAAKFILAKTKLRPKVAVVLGSGLGAFADELENATRIPYGKIPGFPHSTVEGHAGNLVIGKAGGVPIAAMQGRVHFYEGYGMREVIFPMRVLHRMGVKAVILTNAGGGINPELKQGALVLIKDHINLQGTNSLIGTNEAAFGPRFFDMTEAYWPAYRKFALEVARQTGLHLTEGVYCAVSGPSYETPAEIRMMRTMGADVVGMSTVQEVIAAVHMDVRVMAISCVTNMAAGILPQKINHQEVMETGERVRQEFVALLRGVLPRIAEDVKAL